MHSLHIVLYVCYCILSQDHNKIKLKSFSNKKVQLHAQHLRPLQKQEQSRPLLIIMHKDRITHLLLWITAYYAALVTIEQYSDD